MLSSRPRTARRATAVTLACALTTLAVVTACESATGTPGTRTFYGTPQELGNGTVRTYLTRDAQGREVSLGIAMSEEAMQNLPTTPMPGMPSAKMLILDIPAAARSTGFDHVMLDWNPQGHEPAGVYTQPHFDFHFYQVSSAEREQIVPTNPDYATKVANFPDAQYVPARYVAGSQLAGVPPVDAAVPYMGMHWLDTASPELQPPPAGKLFTTTYIYGSWDGRFIFIEPMITKAFIESTKGSATGVSMAVSVPTKVQKPGAYPTSYSIRYDAGAKEYRISLDGLKRLQ